MSIRQVLPAHGMWRMILLGCLLALLAVDGRGQEIQPNTLHVFPVFVDGMMPDGTRYRTTLTLQNPSLAYTASCLIAFLNTTPVQVSAPDGTVISRTLINQILPPGSFNVLRTQRVGALRYGGYMHVSCSAPVTASAAYSAYESKAAEPPPVSETTTRPAPFDNLFQFVHDSREGGRLVLAIVNDRLVSVLASIRLLDIYGRLVSSGQIVIPARSSSTRFLDELLPHITSHRIGVVWVETSAPVYAGGLQVNGRILTTVLPAAY